MEVLIYFNRLKWLFVEGHCRTEGYTAHCIEVLKRSRICILKGMAYSIGGPNAVTDEIFEGCLDRMKTWVRMAAEVAQAEYPSFDLLNSFSVFDISTRSRRQNADPDIEQDRFHDEAVERLAKVFDVDVNAFQSQLLDIGKIAAHFFKTQKIAVWEAWRMAVSRAQSRLQKTHPVDSLVPILQRYLAWNGMTSSGVEQTFTKQQRNLMPCRDHMLDEHEADELFLLDVTTDDKDSIIQSAQHLWERFYGIPRQTVNDRLDKGMKQCQAGHL